jgi:endonuclease YncB( thermonuclease family)
MNRFAIALMTVAALQSHAASACSADLFNDNTSLSEGRQILRNVTFPVSARYCEDAACEPVTLHIWSGDTFIMDRLGQHHEVVTIANIEAPDVHAQCAAEADAAQSAKLQLMALLEGRTFVLARVAGRKDVRSTAFVTVAGRDLGKMMMDRHSARPFETPTRPWC